VIPSSPAVNPRIYLALVHHPVLDKRGRIVSTSITNLDIHDFARLARTYALGGVFLVSPVPDQKALVERIVAHWRDGYGREYNPTRHEALKIAHVAEDLASARDRVRAAHGGEEPLLFATSAKFCGGVVPASEVRRRAAERPAIVLFGTGFGLADEVLDLCDARIEGIAGADGYNHLSVRAAAAITVDRIFRDR